MRLTTERLEREMIESIFMIEAVEPATVPAPGEVPVVDAKRKATRVIQLDFLRGIAILMVLGNHALQHQNAGPGRLTSGRHTMTEPEHQSFTPSTPLALGGRVVDLDAGILRDANGASIALRPQAWAVLALLLSQIGKVVTKTQLLDTVWAGRVVTDASLARAVGLKALAP